ncbi:MAG: chlorite dismutase family protein [Hyphomicrobiales bacterium]|nr:chlorite dismutase family protein [Hyphomicrobiales bacterium]
MFTVFSACDAGAWRVTSITAVCGEPLPAARRVAVDRVEAPPQPSPGWPLAGVASHARYVERPERAQLVARQAGLGRPEATRAALIPIAKLRAWWEMTQDERRRIFEAESRHIAGSLKYLPAVARQLYHCRDLGQPFDFLTWFEFAPEHEAEFDALLVGLRASPEWRFVTREIDIRLSRA